MYRKKAYLEFVDKWKREEKPLMKAIEKQLIKDKNIKHAVNKVFEDLEINEWLQDEVLNLVAMQTVVSGVELVSKVKFKRWYLGKKYNGTEVPLFKTIKKKNTQKAVISQLTKNMNANKTWLQTVKNFEVNDITEGKLPAYLNKLVRLSDQSGLGIEQVKQYQRQLKIAQRNIDRLASNGAPTKRLKVAYQKVLNATKTAQGKVLKSSISKAVSENARYNAQRIARTEIARASTSATQEVYDNDDDIIGWRSELSGSHVVTDVCDFYAQADLYGMGAGVFPKSISLGQPYHSNCLCYSTPVYRGDVKLSFGNKAGAKWLKKHPRLRSKMMTKKNEKKFLKNPNNWQQHLTGYNKLKKRLNKIPDELIKK